MIHFSSWSNSIEGKENHEMRVDMINNEGDVIIDNHPNIIKIALMNKIPEQYSGISWAPVDDLIHVKIKVVNVEFSNISNRGGVSSNKPRIEVGNAHINWNIFKSDYR